MQSLYACSIAAVDLYQCMLFMLFLLLIIYHTFVILCYFMSLLFSLFL